MKESRKGSKRQALRFVGCDHPADFKTEFEEGHGKIADISGGGCAISAASLPLTLRQKILLTVDIPGDEAVEIGCRVIRVDEENTALQFICLSDEDRQRIVRYFAEKQRSA